MNTRPLADAPRHFCPLSALLQRQSFLPHSAPLAQVYPWGENVAPRGKNSASAPPVLTIFLLQPMLHFWDHSLDHVIDPGEEVRFLLLGELKSDKFVHSVRTLDFSQLVSPPSMLIPRRVVGVLHPWIQAAHRVSVDGGECRFRSS